MSSLRVVNVPLREAVQEHEDTNIDTPSDAPESTSFVASPAAPSMFDAAPEPHDGRYTEPTTVLDSVHHLEDLQCDLYNLKPPPPALAAWTGVETLATRLFSVDHLNEILRDCTLALAFSRFLAKYRPAHSKTLQHYFEAKKAVAAVEYANALVSKMQSPPDHPRYIPAVLDNRFEAWKRRIVQDLVEEALPAYLTHRLVSVVTDILVKEITINNSAIAHGLIPSLAEVYCITDPSMPDNPIVYASEEFYHMTQYTKENVIGRNCRFLQGPRTSPSAIRRLIAALTKGEEVCETLINYRRDGSPFMNLLTIAPLYDNKGAVRYFLGCQINVTSLIEHGCGLESFAQLLSKDRLNYRCGCKITRDPKQALEDLGQLLTEDEAEVVRSRAWRPNLAAHALESLRASSTIGVGLNRGQSVRSNRIVLGMTEASHEPSAWPGTSLESSGRPPGVYQKYMLVRPYPSLRIIFTSPALRIPGLLHTKILDKIGAPSTVREGLVDALSRGIGVTAKVTWLTAGCELSIGKPRWIHCTPLLGSDDQVGAWVVVMVENESVTGSLSPYCNRNPMSLVGAGRGAPGADRYSTYKLYSDYLKREGRPLTSDSQQTSSSTREQREADEHFRDF